MEAPDWGSGSMIMFWMWYFDDNKLKFHYHENQSCLQGSRTLLKSDDTLLEFRTWQFLNEAGVLDHILDVFLDDNKLLFQFSEKSVMFEGVKNPPKE